MAGRQLRAATVFVVFAVCLVASGQDSGWLNPDSSRPDFSQSYANADSIVIQWQGLNKSLCDLWLTGYDTSNDYMLRIAANLNLSDPGGLPWIVTVNETEIDIDDRFKFSFIPTGTTYNASQTEQFASPGFLLLQRGEAAPSNSSASITVFVAASSSSTASSTSGLTLSTSLSSSATSPTASAASDSSPGMHPGTKVGIAIAATAFIIIILALLLWILRLRRRVKAATNHRSAGIIPSPSDSQEMAASETQGARSGMAEGKRISGLHEAMGDRRQPAELNASATKNEVEVYHELAG